MILTGSYASFLRGDLNPIRHCPVDFDIWGTESEKNSLYAVTPAKSNEFQSGTYRYYWVSLQPNKTMFKIDFDIEQAEYKLYMDILDDYTMFNLFGMDIKVCSLKSQVAITRALIDSPWDREKHQQDLAFWINEDYDKTLYDLSVEYFNKEK